VFFGLRNANFKIDELKNVLECRKIPSTPDRNGILFSGCLMIFVVYWLLEMASSEILQPKKDIVDGGNMETKSTKAIRFKKNQIT